MGTIEQVKQMKIEAAREEGRKEAVTEFNTAVVGNLLAGTRFSDKRIADIVEVSEAFVRRVKRKMK